MADREMKFESKMSDAEAMMWNVEHDPRLSSNIGSITICDAPLDFEYLRKKIAQAVKDALAPWHASYDYYNFQETPAAASTVLPAASYRRLQEIKARYDPDQVIISTHPVWPARP